MEEPMQNQADVPSTLKQRGSRYGPFDREAEMVEAIMEVLASGKRSNPVPHVIAHGTHMIVTKLVRTWNGDALYPDNHHDIGGYALLMENYSRDVTDGKRDL
jgi:hypothetical protein